ncbi:MAG: aminoacyl-tRNA hydrolase [Candidatus Margulisiibacteriota bacterium]|jgi:PTH1 family peptidyl-tRNA hydrolase
MKLIIGLGNPGKKHSANRHNVGFMVLDQLAAGSPWKKKHQADVLQTGDLILAKPQTFMNLSGQAVAEIIRFYKIQNSSVLLVYDDLDTAFGKLTYREKGSSGGHNGIKSICEHLGTDQVQRIKIGIGRPPQGMSAADYVLQDFSKEEKLALDDILALAVKRVGQWGKETIH